MIGSLVPRRWHAMVMLPWVLTMVTPWLLGQEAQTIPGRAPPLEERVRWERNPSGIRILTSVANASAATRRRLLIYATPNGNSLEQTWGCSAAPGRDFRFDIQHIAAQTRRLREIDTQRDTVLAIVQAPKLSWPDFRRSQPDANTMIKDLVDGLERKFVADELILSGHSGGGSLIFAYLEAVQELPPVVTRLVFLDANYAFAAEAGHGDTIWNWLNGNPARSLVVLAYDDRAIELNGTKVVGPTGGTYRATLRMLEYFGRRTALSERRIGPLTRTTGLNGQLQFYVHGNPENRILHTALVGEMNGLLEAVTVGTEQEGTWGTLGGPRAYTQWIQDEPIDEREQPAIADDVPPVRLAIPERPSQAETGSALMARILELPLEQREVIVVNELRSGNCPGFLRTLVPLRITAADSAGKRQQAVCFVTSDYVCVGSDDNFVRIPLTPSTAVAIAKEWGCCLITTKISDAIDAAATCRLAPWPLTQDRERSATFLLHQRTIEDQLRGQPRPQLISGIKKDVVLSGRHLANPHRVAIYGWHKLDGRPIQPLYAGHRATYVDYSHGIRLVHERILVDGRERRFEDILKDRHLCGLISAEGPIDAGAVGERANGDR